jgi:hypothetical protein
MENKELVLYIFIFVLVILFVIQLVANLRQAQASNQQQIDLAAIFQKTVQDLLNNPVYFENAKAVGQSIPMETFNKIYPRLDAAEAFVGEETHIGKLLQRVEDALKKIDSDPANDPVDEGLPVAERKEPGGVG